MCEISVIIPIYNAEKFIARCLESVLRQSFQSYEIICVNDCSPDGSREIILEYVKKYSQKIRFLENEKNTGPGLCRDWGVKEANGRYVTFIDSDDYIADDFLKTYYDEIKKEDYDIVIGGYTKDIAGKYKKYLVNDCIWSVFSYTIGCAKLYNKDFLINNNIDFSEIRCGEDILFSMSVFFNDAKYSVIRYAGYYYYFNEKSTTSTLSYDKKLECDISKIFDMFLMKYDYESAGQEKKYLIQYNYIANMINALIVYGHGCKPDIMDKKYKFFIDDLKNKFPDYKENKFLKFGKAKKQSLKIRLAVETMMFFIKIGIVKFVYRLISLL